MENFSTSGVWWVPSKGPSRVAGVLSFSENDGLRLKIDRSLTIGKDGIVLGRAGGRQITLQNCYEIASTSHGLQVTGQEYLIETAFLGAALTKPAHFRFRKAVFELTHLIDWVSTSGIRTGFSTSGDFTVTYKRPDDTSITLPAGTLSLAFTGTYPLGGPNLTIQESVRWELISSTRKTTDELLKVYIAPLWNLLRLSTLRDNSLERLVVYRKPDANPREAIQVIFKTGYSPSRTQRLSSSELLFSLRDIGASSADVIKNWLQIQPKVAPLIENLVGPSFGLKLGLAPRLLNLAQAAEVYHRLFHTPQTDLPAAEHEARVNEILSVTPEAHKTWLKQKLQYTNELRLIQRLNAILKEANSTVKVLLPSSSKRNRFTFKVAQIRNDLTHRLNTNINDEQLFIMGEILFFVITACLLIRCGIPEDRVATILGNNFRFARAIENTQLYL